MKNSMLLLYHELSEVFSLTTPKLNEEIGCAPYCCKARGIRVLNPVIRTPHHKGILKNIFSANVVPITSGISHATIATSAIIHNTRFVFLGYSVLQCSARCFPVTTPKLAASD